MKSVKDLKNSALNPSGPAALPLGNDFIASQISFTVKLESNSFLACSLNLGRSTELRNSPISSSDTLHLDSYNFDYNSLK